MQLSTQRASDSARDPFPTVRKHLKVAQACSLKRRNFWGLGTGFNGKLPALPGTDVIGKTSGWKTSDKEGLTFEVRRAISSADPCGVWSRTFTIVTSLLSGFSSSYFKPVANMLFFFSIFQRLGFAFADFFGLSCCSKCDVINLFVINLKVKCRISYFNSKKVHHLRV